MQTRSLWRSAPWYAASFVLGALVMLVVGLVLVSIQQRKDEALQRPLTLQPLAAGELDPAAWGRNYPREYERFARMQDDTVRTAYGGSVPYNKLETTPALVRLWAGYAFSKDFNEDRSHWYALIDQKQTKRQQVVKQPGACANCHAGEAPQLIAELGWEQFNATPYAELGDRLHTGGTCADCHDPETMQLVLTRPALINALAARGIDWTKATRQEMRSLVCNQCHVEYYFQGEQKVLTFPWDQGLGVDDIEAYYDARGFKDWSHAETGAPMLKMQHPESELYSTGLHAANGVACADCHMPYIRDGAVKISDHWIRSPLSNVENACQTCHNIPAEQLRTRVTTIQDRTASLLRLSETAILEAMDAIAAARAAGATDADLEPALALHRRAQMRWDFISSENSTGFHSPQEAARVLAMAMDFARQAQLAAVRVTPGLQAGR
jgi:nitrite reductase (cytochrome c-552)